MNCVKRIALMVIRNILLVPFMWCKLCYHAHHVDKYTEEEHYKMLKFIVRRANKGGNVTIAAEGRKSNHRELWCGKYSERKRVYLFPKSSGNV